MATGLSDDFLQHARMLSELNEGKPCRADGRRAVSAAYYSLFHLLIESSVEHLAKNWCEPIQIGIHRAYGHKDMKTVCEIFKLQTLSQKYRFLLADGISTTVPDALKKVACAFIDLQDLRHAADYQISPDIAAEDICRGVLRASEAFEQWKSVSTTEHAKLLLTMLLLKDKIELISKNQST